MNDTTVCFVLCPGALLDEHVLLFDVSGVGGG